jgi:GPH family glycoside/pentoside/hexuronide:cation symporter
MSHDERRSATTRGRRSDGGGAVDVTTALPRRTVASYASGSLATGTFGTVPGLVLLYYLTDTLAVPAALAGAAVFVPKFLDVLWNPVVGGWSDRTRSRFGPRRPWMLAGTLTLPPLFVLMFAVPDGPAGTPAAAALWVAVAFLLAGAAYGLFQVPYISLPAELTPVPDERSRLQTARVVVVSVGILVGGAAAPALVSAGGDGRAGYLLMAVVVAAVLAVGTAACTLTVPTTHAVTGTEPAAGPGAASFPGALREARRAPRYWVLYTGFLAQSLAVAVALAAIPYYARYVLDGEGFTSVLFAAFVGPALLVTPLWRRVEARRGKRWCLVSSSWLFAAGAVVAAPGLLAPALPTAGFVVCGFAYAGMQVFAYSMLSDTLAERRDDGSRAGLLAGLWTASETAMFAVGPGVVGALLAVSGFVSSADDEPVAQPGTALVAIAVAAGIVPALLVALSTTRFARYPEEDAA